MVLSFLELMKLIFAVLDVSLTMGLTRCYKAEGFFYIYQFKWCCHFVDDRDSLLGYIHG